MLPRIHEQQHLRPLIVDMGMDEGEPVSVVADIPDTILLVEAKDPYQAREHVRAELTPDALKAGTINVMRAEESGKWWVFGVFLRNRGKI